MRPRERVVEQVDVRPVLVLDLGRRDSGSGVSGLDHAAAQVQWPARSAAASMTFTFGPSASRKLSSSSSSMIASPKPAAISIAVERMRRNWAKLDAASVGDPAVLAAHRGVDGAVALGVGLATSRKYGSPRSELSPMTTHDGLPVGRARAALGGRLHEVLRLDELLGRDEPDPLDRRDRLDLLRVGGQQEAPVPRRDTELLLQLVDERLRRPCRTSSEAFASRNTALSASTASARSLSTWFASHVWSGTPPDGGQI